MIKEKIFVSAYACEPHKGSEIGVGWNWILQMSKQFELWVLTRANNQEPIELYFHEHPEDNYGINFVYFDLPDWIKRWKKQMRGIYFYYPLWTRASRKIADQIIEENNIHIYHQLTYGNALWGVNPIVKKMVFIWGPIGGLEIIQREYTKHFSYKSRLIENGRHAVVKVVSCLPGYQFRCKAADLILCKTRSTLEKIPKRYRKKAMLCTDVAADILDNNTGTDTREFNKDLTFISVGRLDGWRGFDLLIEAFVLACSKTDQKLRLRILGAGKEKERLKNLIAKLGMTQNITLLGNVSMEQYREEMQQSDVVLNASLKEGGVTTAFDCVSYSKPLVCLDSGGYTSNFDDTCAVIIPRQNRAHVISDFAHSIISMTNSEQRMKYADGMKCRASKMSWNVKGEVINQMIMNVIRPLENTMTLPPPDEQSGLIPIFYKTVGNMMREIVVNRKLRKQLENHEFTIICSNCHAGKIYHDLNVKFHTPTINLYFFPDDFVRFCERLPHYLSQELFEFESPDTFPVGKLDDVKIYFNHAKDFSEAKELWDKRKERVNYDNLFFMMHEYRGCTYEILKRFDQLPYPKVVFTAFPYSDIQSAVYIPGYREQGYIGWVGNVKSLDWKREYENGFDVVNWLNRG